jgi:hypothetical protein
MIQKTVIGIDTLFINHTRQLPNSLYSRFIIIEVFQGIIPKQNGEDTCKCDSGSDVDLMHRLHVLEIGPVWEEVVQDGEVWSPKVRDEGELQFDSKQGKSKKNSATNVRTSPDTIAPVRRQTYKSSAISWDHEGRKHQEHLDPYIKPDPVLEAIKRDFRFSRHFPVQRLETEVINSGVSCYGSLQFGFIHMFARSKYFKQIRSCGLNTSPVSRKDILG